GDLWWVANGPSMSDVRQTRMRVGGTIRFSCIEVWGVALSERPYGYGDGSYSRELLITQVVSMHAPSQSPELSQTLKDAALSRACFPRSNN
ncbi:MAG: hypothetical protein ABUL55_00460, partial [Pseudomonadota bacterium]